MTGHSPAAESDQPTEKQGKTKRKKSKTIVIIIGQQYTWHNISIQISYEKE
jgi:hypothetical protein